MSVQQMQSVLSLKDVCKGEEKLESKLHKFNNLIAPSLITRVLINLVKYR